MDSKKSLSEISHLFLSDVRSRQPGGARPNRIPPRQQTDASVDMSPEEFAASLEAEPHHGETHHAEHVSMHPATRQNPETHLSSAAPKVSAILFSHLLDRHGQGVRQYARHIAAQSGNVGLIEADSAELGVSCFELNGGEAATPITIDATDTRQIGQTLAELAFDVSRWLISLPNPRTAEARELLRLAPHWILLTTAEHADVVATYRALKGLADLEMPRLSLVVLNARDDAQADAVFRKLDAVSRQFLGCALEREMPVRPVQNVLEHAVLTCRLNQEKPQPVSAPHWNVVAQFVATAIQSETKSNTEPVSHMNLNNSEDHRTTTPHISPTSTSSEASSPAPKMTLADSSVSEVIDLPGDQTEQSILNAVVRQGGAEGRWVQCPIHPPMCPNAILAVGRDHRLILLAVAGKGFSQFPSIGQALRWMAENGELIRMALPQLAIDAAATPAVRLLVDHDDLWADTLQPLLHSDTITVQAYRRLKWGTKTGLLLEAA
ncbi:MAG TPA: hypothetical protein VGG44_06865 [Tepidisphaeraceae bacterium]|jgi:hypothetical protein